MKRSIFLSIVFGLAMMAAGPALNSASSTSPTTISTNSDEQVQLLPISSSTPTIREEPSTAGGDGSRTGPQQREPSQRGAPEAEEKNIIPSLEREPPGASESTSDDDQSTQDSVVGDVGEDLTPSDNNDNENNDDVCEGIDAPIATFGDNIYIAWWTNKTGNDEVMFRASANNGQTFNNQVNLSNSSNADSQDVEIQTNENGNVIITWWERNSTSNEPVVIISTDEGNTFGPLLKLSTNGTIGQST
jgi:hypothetical protein